jgi:hypothetical protein
MKSNDKEKWKEEINDEHETMVNNDIWEPIKLLDLPPNSKLLTTTWTMKKGQWTISSTNYSTRFFAKRQSTLF